jgi:3-mercaptopyruvate sulfurtransferase SseA
LLITVAQLQNKLGAANLCIIDTRPAEDYARAYPGATHFDLFGLSLVDTADAPLNAFMFMIHHVLELRGVSEAKEVVFYEDNSGMRAARGVWFLEYFGHPNVKMLDGGRCRRPSRDAKDDIQNQRRPSLATARRCIAKQKTTSILDMRSDGGALTCGAREARPGSTRVD